MELNRRNVLRGLAGGALIGAGTGIGVGIAQESPAFGPGEDGPTPVDLVNPFIGTDLFFGRESRGILEVFHRGMTVPGPSRPWGLALVSPDTYPKGHGSTLVPDPTDEGSKVWPTGSQTGYAYEDSAIEGFSHTHLNGTGCTGYGNVLVMPTTGAPGTTEAEYRSAFRHETETASPGEYAVHLDDYDVDAELTATTRAGFHRYTFPAADDARLLFDATHHAESSPAEGSVTIHPEERAISGTTTVTEDFCGGVGPYSVHFYARVDREFDAYGTWDDSATGTGVEEGSTRENSSDCGAFVEFATDEGEPVHVKVGISYTSVDGARRNLEAEIPGWSFEDVREASRTEWADKLRRIEVEGGTPEQRVIFYTALYNCLRYPHVFSDVDGTYVGLDGEEHVADGYTKYATHDTWGMFRSLHPLLTLVAPDRQRDMLESMLDYFDTTGWVPRWPLANIHTNVMIANHAVTIFTGAYVKGLRDFDVGTAYDAMVKSATQKPALTHPYEGKRKLDQYDEFGYVPFQTVAESDVKGKVNHETPGNVIHNFNAQTTNDHSVSMTLEYAYNDWVLAELAKYLGRENDYDRFVERSLRFENVFDTDNTGWMRPRHATGNWHHPWSPANGEGFTEGNAWHYSWFVPHDMGSVIDGMGGRETVIDRLDDYSDGVEESGLGGTDYWHGNQPNKGPYLYNFVGQPWKTQEFVRDVIEKVHGTGPGGLMGNEDLGATSAWYVLSAMGFYQTNAASSHYEIGSPIFERVRIHLDSDYYDGDTFVVEAPNTSPENKYVQSATLDDRSLDRPWFSHWDVLDGGHLELEMGPSPNEAWGNDPADAPPMRPEIPTLFGAPGEFTVAAGESRPLVVRLEGDDGEPIAGQEIRVTAEEGRVSPDRPTTGPDGTASVTYEAPPPGHVARDGALEDDITIRFVGSRQFEANEAGSVAHVERSRSGEPGRRGPAGGTDGGLL